ncbi:MAG: DUF2273 domain-containing protein [Clostridia bacterium]|nr:DUF2273 domain-containing protein [Clostridia bacterium]
MLRKLYKFYRKYHYCINGALLGLITGLMFVFFGIIKSIIILACIYAGYFIGKKLMQDRDFIKKLLDRILPPGSYR